MERVARLVEGNEAGFVPADELCQTTNQKELTQHCKALRPGWTCGYTTTFFLHPITRKSTSSPLVGAAPLFDLPFVWLGSYDATAKEWALRAWVRTRGLADRSLSVYAETVASAYQSNSHWERLMNELT